MRECCISANNLNKLNSIFNNKISNKKEKMQKEKIQRVFSLSLRTLLLPDSKRNKDNILYEFKKKEEEIKNMDTPKFIDKKSLFDKFHIEKKKNIFDEKSNFNYQLRNKRKLFDNEFYKKKLKNNINYFNEPIKRYIILTPKVKKENILERNKDKICNLELKLNDDNMNSERNPIRSKKNIKFFVDNFRNLDNKYIDGVKNKYHLSNLKVRTYSTKVITRNSNEGIKKQNSLFKNEEIKFLNNI